MINNWPDHYYQHIYAAMEFFLRKNHSPVYSDMHFELQQIRDDAYTRMKAAQERPVPASRDSR